MNEKLKANLLALREIVMGFLWISFGLFFLIINKNYNIIQIKQFQENPVWLIFNVICVLYGIWRFNKAYNIYKESKY